MENENSIPSVLVPANEDQAIGMLTIDLWIGVFALSKIAPAEAVATLTKDTSTSQFSRVGRWMDPTELKKMRETGKIQWNDRGTHRVALPADRNTYRAAKKGDIYVEYDLPTTRLNGHSTGTRQVHGPGSYPSKKVGANPADFEAPSFQNLVEHK